MVHRLLLSVHQARYNAQRHTQTALVCRAVGTVSNRIVGAAGAAVTTDSAPSSSWMSLADSAALALLTAKTASSRPRLAITTAAAVLAAATVVAAIATIAAAFRNRKAGRGRA
eukprot:CAMPEP_0115862054 /NCGR_PEP_ID=MMETSP0287-20121206/17977_1 /TAXON_ID=412157 /ORGANISM="Chrysochromulina rotalis, Strain UIO044" /LENGTH=112 /DNA_ID=CAMNT_0003316461 /DNA_START=122 /DNA_END=456 /DNA_ORIENTATION=+